MMNAFPDGLRHVHGVMLPLEPSLILALWQWRGQPRAALGQPFVGVEKTTAKRAVPLVL
jgi:hypothetical protein